MNLQDRILLMTKLGDYLRQNTDEYQSVKDRAARENPWFIPEFIERASMQIAERFLRKESLQQWVAGYDLSEPSSPKQVGIVMAGNIPLVGFHDLLCVFISGHTAVIKPSSKDEVLVRHLVAQPTEWEPQIAERIRFADQLSGLDAYIATGSNNTGRYFKYYFGKYPNIIRYNRTSVAVLDGTESTDELERLSDDICLYFGLGCRNVTQLLVPEGYDFLPLLESLRKYEHFIDFHKYKHNYDYHLALLMMGNKFYMTNGSTILTENVIPFTPVSQVHYRYYRQQPEELLQSLDPSQIQAVVGHGHLPFGAAQFPSLNDYADGVDTLLFLKSL